ncbi:hypothetical protein J1N35_025525 [Gossypium stocksii]|uniref:Alcohol dehydrogenase-like C-terminal domain-containing protein n=1 Tax=Gossypium stocksii TaxID=47602 RepID=A0A9D3V6I0_9ROSI|nr:hypothetical protein J1N35_025525 [Gossypium stocksii]
MVADEHFIVHIPDNLPLDAAAPLLCDGITMYSPLRYYGLDKPSLHIGVVGLVGLGHIAMKFTKGAIGTFDGIIDTMSAQHLLFPLLGLLKSYGKLVLVGTLEKPPELSVFPLLQGNNMLLICFHKGDLGCLVFHRYLKFKSHLNKCRREVIAGSMNGGMKETQEMIDSVAKHNIKPDTEVISMKNVNTAMEYLLKADVKYRHRH